MSSEYIMNIKIRIKIAVALFVWSSHLISIVKKIVKFIIQLIIHNQIIILSFNLKSVGKYPRDT